MSNRNVCPACNRGYTGKTFGTENDKLRDELHKIWNEGSCFYLKKLNATYEDSPYEDCMRQQIWVAGVYYARLRCLEYKLGIAQNPERIKEWIENETGTCIVDHRELDIGKYI